MLFSGGSERAGKTDREGEREKEMKTIIVLLKALLAVVVKGGEKCFIPIHFSLLPFLSLSLSDTLTVPSVLS